VAGGKNGTFGGRDDETGSGILPIRISQVRSKPAKAKPGSKSLLTGRLRGKKKISLKLKSNLKLKSSKTTNNKKENNKINRKKKPKC